MGGWGGDWAIINLYTNYYDYIFLDCIVDSLCFGLQ